MSAMTVFCLSCEKDASGGGNGNSETELDEGALQRYLDVQEIVSMNCGTSGCHGSGAPRNQYATFTLQQQYLDLNPVQVTTSGIQCDSNFFKKLKVASGALPSETCDPAGDENMPSGLPALSLDDFRAIREWLRCMDPDALFCD